MDKIQSLYIKIEKNSMNLNVFDYRFFIINQHSNTKLCIRASKTYKDTGTLELLNVCSKSFFKLLSYQDYYSLLGIVNEKYKNTISRLIKQ